MKVMLQNTTHEQGLYKSTYTILSKNIATTLDANNASDLNSDSDGDHLNRRVTICETIRYWCKVAPYILFIPLIAGGLSFLLRHVTNSDRKLLRGSADNAFI